MLYFRNVVAAIAASFALTVLACFTGIRSIRTVESYRIMPSCRACHRLFVLVFMMNDVNFFVDRKIQIILDNNTVNRTTQYNLHVLEKYVKNIRIPKL